MTLLRAITMPNHKNSSSSRVYHCGMPEDVISCQLSRTQSCAKKQTSHDPAADEQRGSDCCCLLASETQAAGPVIGLATDNGLVYSASQGTAMEAWGELGLQALPTTVSSCSNPTSAMAVLCGRSGGSKWVATAHKDFKIRLWQSAEAMRSLEQAGTLPSLRQYLHNWTLQHRYVQTRRHGKKRSWMQHSDTISALAFSADGTLLYSASWDRTVKVWSLAHMRCEESFTAHIDSINTMAVGSADGLLYTGSADKSIKVWSRRAAAGAGSRQRKCKHSMVVALQEQGAAVNALVLSQDGNVMYSGGSDGRIVVWRKSSPSWPHKAAAAGQLLQVEEKLQGHSRAVLCLDLLQSEDDKSWSGMQGLLLSGSADKTIRLWRQQTRSFGGGRKMVSHQCVGVLTGHTAPVRSLRVSVDVEELRGVCAGVAFSGSLDGTIKMWMLATVAEHEDDQHADLAIST